MDELLKKARRKLGQEKVDELEAQAYEKCEGSTIGGMSDVAIVFEELLLEAIARKQYPGT